MALIVRTQIPGMTSEKYEQISLTMLDRLKAQDGFLAHAAAVIPGGIEVVELWESQEAFDVWLKEVVMPTSRKLGVTPPILQLLPAPGQWLVVR
jgi:hypothetical protein